MSGWRKFFFRTLSWCLVTAAVTHAMALTVSGCPQQLSQSESLSGSENKSESLGGGLSDAGVTVALSSSSVQVAEAFTLEVNVRCPEGSTIAFPEFGERLGDFEVIDRAVSVDVPVEGGRLWTMRLQLESLKSGQLVVPTIDIDVRTAQSVEILSTKPMQVDVVSLLDEGDDAKKFRDIRSVIDVELPKKPETAWLLWCGGGLVVFALLAVAMAVLRRVGKVSPSVWAFRELERVAVGGASDSTESNVLLAKQADVLREYLHLRFTKLADVGTTQEIGEALAVQSEIGTELRAEVVTLLTLADEAKFACAIISPEQAASFNRRVRGAIQLAESRCKQHKVSQR